MKFIVDICTRAVTEGVPYAHAYYSRTTLKVLPTPLLTVGRVQNNNVFQINLGELLFRATLKVRLGSCLSTALKMDNLDCTKINAHFKKITACLWEGLIHEC